MSSKPPVGVVCEHSNILASAMQLPQFRKDDEDKWIYYHGYYLDRKGADVKLRVCPKPELWRWRYYLRECGGCGKQFSNPWVPVCEECYMEEGNSQPYLSWGYVIRLDMRLL